MVPENVCLIQKVVPENVFCGILFRMKRFILSKLAQWKNAPSRNPLILKGARQVGKTYALLEFAKEHYGQHHYFNFEKTPALHSVFAESLEPVSIIQKLSLYLGKSIDVNRDLMIWDEIQACPNALTSLKYFSEEMPQANICAAGSLLGVYLNPVSYPVGKVDHLEMHPMSFLEFLLALGEEPYVKLLQETLTSNIPQIAHEYLWNRLKQYFITGGLPEVVKIFCDHQQDMLNAFKLVRKKQGDLIEDYFADIAKHSGKINAMHINRVWRNIPQQLAQAQDGSAKKFKFKGVIPNVDRFAKISDALDWLVSAGLIIKVAIINKGCLPFQAYAKENAFKLFLFDVGILGAMSEINPKTILDYDYGSYKGFFAENYVAQALTFSSPVGLYSWAEGTAEVEFLREIEGNVIPVEVKSGWVTQAKSLKVFSDKYKPPYRVILSAKNFRVNDQVRLLPLYLTERLNPRC